LTEILNHACNKQYTANVDTSPCVSLIHVIVYPVDRVQQILAHFTRKRKLQWPDVPPQEKTCPKPCLVIVVHFST
jgi:hypothetical protein